MTLKERVAAPTPLFFRKIRMIGLALAAISGVLLTAPVSLPVSILSLAGYAGVAGGIMSVISQMAVENSLISKAGQKKNKSAKGKEVI